MAEALPTEEMQRFIPEFHYEYARFLSPHLAKTHLSQCMLVDEEDKRPILTKLRCYDMCGPVLDEPFGDTVAAAIDYIIGRSDFFPELMRLHTSIVYDSLRVPRAEPCLPPEEREWMEVRDAWVTLSTILFTMHGITDLRDDASPLLTIVCSLIVDAHSAMQERYTNASRSLRH